MSESASSAQAGGVKEEGPVEGASPMDVETPADAVDAATKALPEFEVEESDATLIIYPILQNVDLDQLHTIIG
eukprot:4607716-Lingulodinium_polyedra.AAC.1